jgi:hypothetical protein
LNKILIIDTRVNSVIGKPVPYEDYIKKVHVIRFRVSPKPLKATE